MTMGREEGDPGIHMHVSRENCRLNPLCPQLRPQAHALFRAPVTEDKTRSQSNLLYFHLPERERRGEAKKKKRRRRRRNPIIFICPSHQPAENANWGETAAVNSLYFTQKRVYLLFYTGISYLEKKKKV
jgi:hypothetical protein